MSGDIGAASLALRLGLFRRFLIKLDGKPQLFARSETEAIQSASRMAAKAGNQTVTVCTRDPDSGVVREVWSSVGMRR